MSAGNTDSNANAGTSIYLMGHSVLDRAAYRRLLADELHLNVSVDSDFAPTSVWAAMRCKPNLILVNADVPHPNIVDAVQMVTRLSPKACVIVVSAAVDPIQIEPWSRCPLRGYVVKGGGVAELRAAIEAVINGQQYFSAGIHEAFARAAKNRRGSDKLSRRESELLPLLARGLTLREAAASMTISYKTADSYRTNLLRKLGVHDRVELARYAIRQRIIDP